MSNKPTDDSDAIDNMDGGAHLGGTRFGQTGTDAKDKTKDRKAAGDKARPNDGKN